MLVIVAMWSIKRLPFVAVHFAVFVVVPVVGIHRTRRLGHLSLACIALAARIHRTHLLLIRDLWDDVARRSYSGQKVSSVYYIYLLS